MDARLSPLKKRMRELSLATLDNIPRGKVGFSSTTIVVNDETKGEEIIYKLMASEETLLCSSLLLAVNEQPLERMLSKCEDRDS